MESVDVLIIGCGPAGIFSALELMKSANDLRIMMIDKGPGLEKRQKEEGEFILTGWGGTGAYSDGKLDLTPDVGGWLTDLFPYSQVEKLIKYTDNIWSTLAPEAGLYEYDDDEVVKLKAKARKAHLKLVPYNIRHLGSDLAPKVLKRAKKRIEERGEIKLETEADKIILEGKGVKGIKLVSGKEIRARYVIVAPGRSGAAWLRDEMHRLSVPLRNNPVDIGIRVETNAEILEELTEILYEPKLYFFSPTYDETVRTFCVNPYGYIVKEKYGDVVTTNGHSYEKKKSDNTNFALLISSNFTQPFRDPIRFGKHIGRLANMLSGGSVLIQRLGDLNNGRRSTESRIQRSIVEPTLEDAVPGDISYALPHRHLVSLLECLKALDKLASGLWSKHTLLYAAEVKFYSSRIEVTSQLEAKGVKNLFAIGDGSGLTRGLIQSSASGILAARSILLREGVVEGKFPKE